jgi:hypothetical protein
MQYKEQKIPYSALEITFLKKEQRQALLVGGVITLVFAIFPVIAIVNVPHVAAWLVTLLPLAVAFGVGYGFYDSQRDIAGGQKLRIVGTISDKYTKVAQRSNNSTMTPSVRYYLVVGQRDILVKQEHSSRFKIGENVQIDLTPYAHTILSIHSLDKI